MERISIARVVAKLEPGGAQLAALRVARALTDHGFETRFLAGSATDEGLALARLHGVDVEVWGGGQDLQDRLDPAFALWLRDRLRGASVVHAHMYGAWAAAAKALDDDTPLVASEHNAPRPQGPTLEQMREPLRRVDVFYAHGSAARAHVLRAGLNPSRLRWGISPIEDVEQQPLDSFPSPRVVFAGRLHHEKGPDLLLEALARHERPVDLFMLGSGPLESDLRAQVHRLGLERSVCMCGWDPTPARVIAGSSAVVVPSREEAWSQTSVLAMALRVPVIGTRVGDLPITLGKHRGVLVPAEDPGSLARAIGQVVARRDLPDLELAYDYAQRFKLSQVAPVYASCYRSLRRGAAGRRAA